MGFPDNERSEAAEVRVPTPSEGVWGRRHFSPRVAERHRRRAGARNSGTEPRVPGSTVVSRVSDPPRQVRSDVANREQGRRRCNPKPGRGGLEGGARSPSLPERSDVQAARERGTATSGCSSRDLPPLIPPLANGMGFPDNERSEAAEVRVPTLSEGVWGRRHFSPRVAERLRRRAGARNSRTAAKDRGSAHVDVSHETRHAQLAPVPSGYPLLEFKSAIA